VNEGALAHVTAYMEEGERRRISRLRLADTEPGRFVRLSLRPSPQAPARARRLVAGFVGDSVGDALRYALQLVASELVKNAVVYGSRSVPVRLELAVHPDWIELRVCNGGERMHMRELRSRRDAGGRGLEIVDALTWGWSIDTGPLETAVSVRVPIVDSPVDEKRLLRLAEAGRGYGTPMPRRAPGPDRRARRPASSRRS
jgi:anti-sigma regulatory factor (Ser/Thr protein kinase)